MQAFLCARKRWSWVVSAPFIILFHAGKHWMLRNMPCNAAPLVDAKIWEEPATTAIRKYHGTEYHGTIHQRIELSSID